MELLWR